MKNTKIIIAILTLILLAASVFAQEQPTPTPTPENAPTQDVTTQNSDAPQAEPKKEGVIRIGLVKPKTQLAQNSGEDPNETLRQLFASLLTGPSVETVPIEARIPAQINVEAEQKGCDFVLYTSLSKKSKTGIFGSLINVVVPVLANHVQTTGNTDPNNSDANAAQPTATQARTDFATNWIAAKTRAKDEITLDFNLVAVKAATPTLKNSLKAKANADGEDVLSPLMEKAAEEVLQAAMKNTKPASGN